ncbi:RBM25 [Symbiodinium sp. KB8]|nr:RBM25 [Symbiodinium sp. KB8]
MQRGVLEKQGTNSWELLADRAALFSARYEDSDLANLKVSTVPRPSAPGVVTMPPVPAAAVPKPVSSAAIAASTSKVPAKAGQPALPHAVIPGASGVQPCTVYVGRISTEVSDEFVRQLLDKCGKAIRLCHGRRTQLSTQSLWFCRLTSFGFCDFEEPQGVWRAMEFLHEKQLCDKKLLVKCEASRKEEILKKLKEEVGKLRLDALRQEHKVKILEHNWEPLSDETYVSPGQACNKDKDKKDQAKRGRSPKRSKVAMWGFPKIGDPNNSTPTVGSLL